MKIIGLTGPTGAGKSELCNYLAQHGIPSINADRVYHQLLTPPSPCLDELRSRFGTRIINADGTLNRPALAKIVFAPGNEDAHEDLNRITHGYVKLRMRELIETFSKKFDTVIADVPLLFESGFDKECDLTVAVLADRAIRIHRIMQRDSLDYAAADARASAQNPDSFYTEHADLVLYNNFGSEELQKEALKILDAIGGEFER